MIERKSLGTLTHETLSMKRKFTFCFACSLALLALISNASASTGAPTARTNTVLTGEQHPKIGQDGKKKQHPAKHKKQQGKKRHVKHQRRGKKHEGKKHGGTPGRVL